MRAQTLGLLDKFVIKVTKQQWSNRLYFRFRDVILMELGM